MGSLVCLREAYFANEVVVSGDVGFEMFDWLSVDVGVVMSSVMVQFVEGALLEVIVNYVAEFSH